MVVTAEVVDKKPKKAKESSDSDSSDSSKEVISKYFLTQI